MSFRIIALAVVAILFLLIEFYTYSGIKSLIGGHRYAGFWWFLYIMFFLATVVSIAYMMTYSWESSEIRVRSLFQNVMIGMTLTLIITKLAFVSTVFAGDAFRALKLGWDWVASFVGNSPEQVALESRRKFVLQMGLGLASVPFVSFLYGITKGKYSYKINRVKLSFEDLPKEFDGYKIVQISDFHAGSFDNVSEVARGFSMINDQEPDLVLFTGDLVNARADEVQPFVPGFQSIQARDGKYAVLGNHDYGNYVQWSDPNGIVKNMERLEDYYRQMDFTLMRNENVLLNKGKATLRLVGVENWGKPPMPRYGKLDESLQDVDPNDFTILMSHDPSHWDHEILPNAKKVHLTLSGHTHGMQMGVNIPGFKWSPIKYRYPRWSGLYDEEGQYLYVNHGYGFLGFPGRVGIRPEITVIELKSSANVS